MADEDIVLQDTSINTYLKPQSPIKVGTEQTFIYPLTTIDQVIDGNQRLSATWEAYQSTTDAAVNASISAMDAAVTALPTQVSSEINGHFSFDEDSGVLTIFTSSAAGGGN